MKYIANLIVFFLIIIKTNLKGNIDLKKNKNHGMIN